MKNEDSNKILQSSLKDMETTDKKRRRTKSGSFSFQSGSDSVESTDEKIPSLEELKSKYVSKVETDQKLQNFSFQIDAASTENDEIDVKLIKKKDSVESSDSQNELDQERTIIISKNRGLLGSQG